MLRTVWAVAGKVCSPLKKRAWAVRPTPDTPAMASVHAAIITLFRFIVPPLPFSLAAGAYAQCPFRSSTGCACQSTYGSRLAPRPADRALAFRVLLPESIPTRAPVDARVLE